jgi:hypothetical protein
MAIVKKLDELDAPDGRRHTETVGTFSVVNDPIYGLSVQIDTYGSSKREDAGKESQSIWFCGESLETLKCILNMHFS